VVIPVVIPVVLAALVAVAATEATEEVVATEEAVVQTAVVMVVAEVREATEATANPRSQYDQSHRTTATNCKQAIPDPRDCRYHKNCRCSGAGNLPTQAEETAP
jgi:hypothetical protein